MVTFAALLQPLASTILIEILVLILLRERSMRVLAYSVPINVLTNVPLNLFIISFGYTFTTIASGEAIVVLVEALCYYLLLHDLPKALVYSFLCNSISFLTGLLLQLLFVFFQKQLTL